MKIKSKEKRVKGVTLSQTTIPSNARLNMAAVLVGFLVFNNFNEWLIAAMWIKGFPLLSNHAGNTDLSHPPALKSLWEIMNE